VEGGLREGEGDRPPPLPQGRVGGADREQRGEHVGPPDLPGGPFEVRRVELADRRVLVEDADAAREVVEPTVAARGLHRGRDGRGVGGVADDDLDGVAERVAQLRRAHVGPFEDGHAGAVGDVPRRDAEADAGPAARDQDGRSGVGPGHAPGFRASRPVMNSGSW
jgi:hypothetical protein